MKKLLKLIVRTIVPKRILYLLKGTKLYWPEIERFSLYSNTFIKLDNQKKVRGQLTVLYHIIEKGLTMPETRLGFGTKVVLELTSLCKMYLQQGYDNQNQIYKHSVAVLNEYLRFHERNDYELDPEIVKEINEVSSFSRIKECSSQYQFTNSQYFKDSQSSFPEFCLSRHSARNFTKEVVPLEILHQCVDLANRSPSDCNRQPSRVYIIRSQKKIVEALTLQNGNRGFGHLAGTLLVITSDISLFQGMEKNETYFNAGLFSMTLLYALHYFKIGTCLLNWAASNDNDKKLRRLLNIPENELVGVMIACGYLPDAFKVAFSPRQSHKEIIYDVD